MTTHPVNATRTSVVLVELLAEGGPLGVTELATRAGVSKGTVHNHLTTLRRLDYVRKTEREYDLTLRMLAIGEQIRERHQLFMVSKSHIENLSQTTSEHVALYIEEEGRGTRISHAGGANGWSPPIVDGEQSPLHATAAGKAILARLSDARIDRILDKHGFTALTDRTVTDRKALFEQLRKVRASGAAFSRGERFEGINGVAAPIRTGEERRTGAVSVVGPTSVLNGRYLEEDVTGQVLSTAKRIEVDMRTATGDG
jgi:DNA-binding IclR family transcriptional regulator